MDVTQQICGETKVMGVPTHPQGLAHLIKGMIIQEERKDTV